MRILITGAGGSLGSGLVEALADQPQAIAAEVAAVLASMRQAMDTA